MEEILGFKISGLEDFKRDIQEMSDKFKILASDTDGYRKGGEYKKQKNSKATNKSFIPQTKKQLCD